MVHIKHINNERETEMAKTKQAGLWVQTHKLLEELIEEASKGDLLPGEKPSKASVIHKLVDKAHTQRGLKK